MSVELFEKLEARIDRVLEKDRESRGKITELEQLLAERDERIRSLEKRIGDLESEKEEIRHRLDSIIEKLDGMLSQGDVNAAGTGSDSWS